MDRYFLGVAEDEVVSTLYHGNEHSGYATAEEAWQMMGKFDGWPFNVYRVRIEEVPPPEEGRVGTARIMQ